MAVFSIDVFLVRALNKSFSLSRHFLWVFFAHGAPQNIRVAHAIAAEHLGDLHDLFLIDDDAVGVFQNRLQQADADI